MKVYAAHDKEGTIRSVFVPAPGLDEDVALDPEPGEQVSEIDVADLDSHLDEARIRALVTSYRVVNGALSER